MPDATCHLETTALTNAVIALAFGLEAGLRPDLLVKRVAFELDLDHEAIADARQEAQAIASRQHQPAPMGRQAESFDAYWIDDEHAWAAISGDVEVKAGTADGAVRALQEALAPNKVDLKATTTPPESVTSV